MSGFLKDGQYSIYLINHDATDCTADGYVNDTTIPPTTVSDASALPRLRPGARLLVARGSRYRCLPNRSRSVATLASRWAGGASAVPRWCGWFVNLDRCCRRAKAAGSIRAFSAVPVACRCV